MVRGLQPGWRADVFQVVKVSPPAERTFFVNQVDSMRIISRSLVSFLLLSAAMMQAQVAPAQSDERPSLGAIARAAREKKPKSKASVVLDDDTPLKPQGPIPDIASTWPDNANDITAAIASYSKTHTKEETKVAIRAWYDRQDSVYLYLAAETLKMREIIYRRDHSASNRNPWEYADSAVTRDGVDAQESVRAYDSKVLSQHYWQLNQIQMVLRAVRSYLERTGIEISWFTLREQNGDAHY